MQRRVDWSNTSEKLFKIASLKAVFSACSLTPPEWAHEAAGASPVEDAEL